MPKGTRESHDCELFYYGHVLTYKRQDYSSSRMANVDTIHSGSPLDFRQNPLTHSRDGFSSFAPEIRPIKVTPDKSLSSSIIPMHLGY